MRLDILAIRGSGPDGLAEKDGAKALSGAASGDTATTQLDKPSRTKNLIIEFKISPLFIGLSSTIDSHRFHCPYRGLQDVSKC